MAEVKVNKQSSEERGRQGGGQTSGLARRMENFPAMFSMHPRDLFRMSPFDLMRRFSDEMDRMWGGWSRESGKEMMWSPAAEVSHRGDNLVVCAELPGLNKDDVKVEVTEEGLVIQGERKREQEESREGYYHSERSYGQFCRVIPLPEDANIEQTRAQFNNGVLEVTIPVPHAQQKRREIPIEAGTGAQTRTAGGASGTAGGGQEKVRTGGVG